MRPWCDVQVHLPTAWHRHQRRDLQCDILKRRLFHSGRVFLNGPGLNGPSSCGRSPRCGFTKARPNGMTSLSSWFVESCSLAPVSGYGRCFWNGGMSWKGTCCQWINCSNDRSSSSLVSGLYPGRLEFNWFKFGNIFVPLNLSIS